MSASQVTAETLLPTLSQELIVVLPEILAAVIAWALLGWKQFPQEMGLKAESVKKEILSLLAGGYLGALFLALLTVKSEPLTICYQWGYYLFLIALWEEFIFRGFPEQIINLFGKESELYIKFAVKCFRVYLLACFLIPAGAVTGIFFQAIGKPVPATLLSLSRQIIFLIPAMLIFGYFMGVEGVLWAGPFSDGLSGVISLITVWLSWKKIFGKEAKQ